jgi:hypothetical protein
MDQKPHAKAFCSYCAEKWNPFRGSTLWDPIRELEEMQNRLSSLLGRRLPLLREGGEEEFTVTEWSPAVDIAEDDRVHCEGRAAGSEQREH